MLSSALICPNRSAEHRSKRRLAPPQVAAEALKRKQEEVAAAKRQLQERQTSARVEENKRFLDNEIERVLQKGKQIEELEEEVRREPFVLGPRWP